MRCVTRTRGSNGQSRRSNLQRHRQVYERIESFGDEVSRQERLVREHHDGSLAGRGDEFEHSAPQKRFAAGVTEGAEAQLNRVVRDREEATRLECTVGNVRGGRGEAVATGEIAPIVRVEHTRSSIVPRAMAARTAGADWVSARSSTPSHHVRP